LEIGGDVALAPVPASPVGCRSVLALASFRYPPVEDQVSGVAAEYLCEIRIQRGLFARDDNEKSGHELPPRA
jgi:hypothetical protein